jgi:aminodeoxyfutalosine deaminase
MAFSLRARVVFPVDRPPIEHGVVSINGEHVTAVGASAAGGVIHDLGEVGLLPGLVNAHTHLEFSHLARPLGYRDISIVDWIRLVIAERGRGDSDTATSAGWTESLRHGASTIGDISAVSSDVAAQFEQQGDMTSFVEAIGFSRARAESAFAATIERLDAISDHRGQRLGISPHAPYSVSPALLKKLIALAKDRNIPVATHLAESREELEFLYTGGGPFQELLEERSMWDADAVPRGSRPLDYLRLLANAPRVLVIHGNYLDEAERTFLAAHADRMSLVYCPRTHAYFGHPPYPLIALLNAGARVALGTDSRASNPDLSLLAELRHVAKAYPALDPHTVLSLGTLAGAEALGRAGEVGSISTGKLANMVAVPVPEGSAGTPDDVLEALLASDTPPTAVWLRGQPLP